MNDLDRNIAEATLGIDTLWGGDVQCPSGTGRFIADSWFSDEPLPRAYTHPAAAKLRASGGVSGKTPDRQAIDEYLAEIDVRAAIAAVAASVKKIGGLRGSYLEGLAISFEVMWDLAMEMLGNGEAVPYERCVRASTGAPPRPSNPAAKRERVATLLGRAGYAVDEPGELLTAVDDWRRSHLVAQQAIPKAATELIAKLEALTKRNVMPHMPAELQNVPRANVEFLPIENAWFSGSMNYLGRARKPDGSPCYEASYEINAALEISLPEFYQLVSHEVVPGHVTTFAYLQNLYVRGVVGFEATVPTMNTRAATLSEGIANNAICMAHGVMDLEELGDPELELGALLALLQDDAKNQSSYLTWQEKEPQEAVAERLRQDYLVSPERADKLSGAWGRHPLSGRMYLPAYRAGTELVADLRRRHRPEDVLPALFGCRGIVDVVTINEVLA